jgi:hypothetical protein
MTTAPPAVPETSLSIDTFETVGTLDNLHPAKWTSVVYDHDGQIVASSGLKDSDQESIDAVNALLATV